MNELSGENQVQEVVIYPKNQSSITLIIYYVPFFDKKSPITGFVSFHLIKKIVIIIGLNLLVQTGFCQRKTTVGLIVGSGLPHLSIGYSIPNVTLGGVTLLKPFNVGIYGKYAISNRFRIGLDLTYYRLPLHVSDGNGNTVFTELFTYLNIAPFISYEPVKWASVAFNLSVRPLLDYSPRVFSPSGGLLSYYGPRLTVKPVKNLEIDLGYEIYRRPFANANIIGDYTSFANTTVYANFRFTLFTK